MRYLIGLTCAVALAMASIGCGDNGGSGGTAGTGGSGGGGGMELAPELFGTWDVISLEAASMTTSCPGEIMLSQDESVSCGTQFTTLSPDGTFVEIETTDEFGNPDDFRSEGTWSTQGSELSLTYTQEGPDENNLQPIDPPETETGTWSVTGTTLTVSLSLPPPSSTVVATLEKR